MLLLPERHPQFSQSQLYHLQFTGRGDDSDDQRRSYCLLAIQFNYIWDGKLRANRSDQYNQEMSE